MFSKGQGSPERIAHQGFPVKGLTRIIKTLVQKASEMLE